MLNSSLHATTVGKSMQVLPRSFITPAKASSSSHLTTQSKSASGSITTTTAAAAVDVEGAATGKCKVTWIGVSEMGYLVVYCSDHFVLFTFSLNGELLASAVVDE